MPPIYFDSAATTRLHPSVLEAMLPFWGEMYGNPSSIHALGRQVRAAIEKSRKTVATCIGSSTAEIFFTSGGTEANNTALHGAVYDLGVQHIITSPLEHHCVLHSAQALANYGTAQIHYTRLLPNGHIDLENLAALLTHLNKGDKVLVSLMHGNNEIGNLLDVEAVSKLCIKHNALFHTDTVQTFGYYPIDVQKIKIDFLTGSAHKLHGPKGVGFLYINHQNKIKAYLHGGSQERNMRAGTENVSGIIGLAKAAEIAHNTMENNRQYITELKNYLIQRLRNDLFSVQFNGDWANGSYKVLNVQFPPSEHNDLLLFNLDIAGICASGGSACSSGVDAGSHVLNALNVNPATANIRFSFSVYNKKEEIDTLIEKLTDILKLKKNTNSSFKSLEL